MIHCTFKFLNRTSQILLMLCSWGCSSAVKRWTAALKVTGSIPVRGENPCGWKTLSVHPAVNGYLIQFGEGTKGSDGEEIGATVTYAEPREKVDN